MGKELDEWKDALNVIAEALNKEKEKEAQSKYDYAVIGSGAYVLHGVTYENPNDNPADIDITTTSPKVTRRAIENLSQQADITVKMEPDSSLAVAKYLITFKNGNSYHFEFTHAEDFGFNSASLTSRDKIQVTSLIETLQSSFLRPEHRIKDLIAFRDMIKSNAELLRQEMDSHKRLNPSFRQAVNTMLDIFADPQKASNPEIVDRTVAQLLPRLELKSPQHNRQPETKPWQQTNYGEQRPPINHSRLFSRQSPVPTAGNTKQRLESKTPTGNEDTVTPARIRPKGGSG